MKLDYNLFNILILFGAIQGFILCIFLYKKRKVNPRGVDFFLLFIFSLAFFNLIYAFLDMKLFVHHRPLHMFPFPYKWLIGAGFYFYVKNQFSNEGNITYHKKEWYLLAPAIAYFFLRLYWFVIAVRENSFRITSVVIETGFFRIHEFFILFFSLFLGIASLLWLRKKRTSEISKKRTTANRAWLLLLTKVFIVLIAIDIVLFSIDLYVNNSYETFDFYYATLILNSVFIYWIGFVGFTKSNILFVSVANETVIPKSKLKNIASKLEKATQLELFSNPNISLPTYASEIECSPKELSNYINEVHAMNFSEYINLQRVEKVKALLQAGEAKKYTLVTLSEMAGFNSKSSFNSEFKKATGETPSAYKKRTQGI